MWADQRAKVKEIKDLAIEKETLEKVVKMMREQEIVLHPPLQASDAQDGLKTGCDRESQLMAVRIAP